MTRCSVLFVCLGNICRSPLAEAVFRHVAHEAGLQGYFDVDSAGIKSWNRGKPPDQRVIDIAARHGISVTHKARRISKTDIERFDYLICMDRNNFDGLQKFAQKYSVTLNTYLLRTFDAQAGASVEVPDPFYDGPSAFEQLYDVVFRSSLGLLEFIRKERGP